MKYGGENVGLMELRQGREFRKTVGRASKEGGGKPGEIRASGPRQVPRRAGEAEGRGLA